MFAPVSHTIPSLKRKESCLNVSVPFSKRSKFTRDLCKTSSDSAAEVEINYKEVEDLSFWDTTESKDVEDLTVSDTSESLIEDSINGLEIYSHVRSKIGYEVECFQLNVSDVFKVVEDNSNVRSLIKENHYQCLKKTKRFFNAVPPIETTPLKINLKYDPHIDECLPNLMSFTDIELSFLREVACGCRPLSWDEYEKSLLIDHGNNDIGFDDCLRDSILECNNSDKKSKYIIEDLKLFSHNNENELFITEGLIDQATDDHLDLEDPLEVQCNGKSLHKTQISSEAILPISADELSFLKKRMNSFKLSVPQQLEMSESTSEKLADELSASDDGNNASSGDIIIIDEPPKEKTSSESKNEAIDFIVDSIDDILKNVNLSEENSLDLPSSSSSISKSSMNVDPSTSGAAHIRNQQSEQSSCNCIEKCSEFVTNMAKGLVISDSDLNALKRLDCKKKEIEEQEKYIEQQEKLAEQQQQQQVSVGEILLVIVDNV
ncbi:hypothetical protein Avbf_09854 [Armadillidium vulgare]|nr:hypothetical protein Avbf_09854 [Armadillidium vulgare]